ncbi:short chain dehydrogenase, partial [Rhizoctonia solani 123E]
MLPVTWMVTGSSRGIGLALVTELAKYSSNIIFATCRHPDKATRLKEVAEKAYTDRVHIVPLDVTDETSIIEVANMIGDKLGHVGPVPGGAGLDYLIQNAAVTLPSWSMFLLGWHPLQWILDQTRPAIALARPLFTC